MLGSCNAVDVRSFSGLGAGSEQLPDSQMARVL